MKLSLFVGGIIGLFIMVSPLSATVPDSVGLSFDTTEHILKVRVFHPVKNTVDHHIGKMSVVLNGKEIITQQFNNQTNKGEQDVAYTIIDAKPSDKISVTAICSIFGKKNGILTLPSPKSGGSK